MREEESPKDRGEPMKEEESEVAGTETRTKAGYV